MRVRWGGIMTDDLSEVGKLLEEIRGNHGLNPANFTLLHAGDKEDDYLDIDFLFGDSGAQLELMEEVESKLNEYDDYDRLAFINKDYGPIGMLPYASEITNRVNKEGAIVQLDRRIRLDHLRVKGVTYDSRDLKNDRVVIVDDVITTGDTQENAIDILEDWGAEVVGTVCVYARDLDTLEYLENSRVEFSDYVFSREDLLELGYILSDDIADYADKDVLQKHREVFGKSDEELNKMYNDAKSRVDEMVQDEPIDEETRQALINYKITSSIFEELYPPEERGSA